jgi:hypothetical protein
LSDASFQLVERCPLRRRGLDRLADAVDRQVGDARHLLIAKLRKIALIFSGGVRACFCSGSSCRTVGHQYLSPQLGTDRAFEPAALDL